MLRLIIGESGSGKTFKITNEIKLKSKSGKRILVIVPEQYSFATERRLSEKLQGEEMLNVEVLSFTRLCEDIFSLYNDSQGEYIDDSGRHILMSVALNTVRDQLELYRKYCDRIEFISSMVITLTEFKYAGITAEDFSKISANCNKAFGDKLREISLIYNTYQALLDSGFSEKDDFKKAVKLAQENGYFCDCEIFIDSFTAFMAGERELIACMLEDGDCVNVSICSDCEMLSSDPADIFYSPKKTISKLISLAKDLDKEVEIEKLSGNKRQSKNDLTFLSQNFLKNKQTFFEVTPECVEIYNATDVVDEIEYIAAMIGDLTRNHGYRYRDIVLVTRTSESYLETIRTIFSRYNIPVFYDRRNEILKTPLVKAICSFLNLASGVNTTDALFSLLKSPYSPFEFSDVCELENYCFIWDLEFDDFKSEFKKDVGGLNVTGDKEKLNLLNEIRHKLVCAVDKFIQNTKECNGRKFSSSLYEFLEDFGIKNLYSKQVVALKKNADISGVRELTAVWNTLVECLNQMALSLNDVCYGIDEMSDLFRVALSGSDYANIPHHLDEVSVGDANRIRYNEPKIVFLFGANDGEFPQYVTENSLIDKRERVYLKENNLQLDSDTAEAFSNERMYAYHAVSAPSDKLFVSYTNVSIKGQPHSESLIVGEISALIPKLTLKTRQDINERLFLHTLDCVRYRYAMQYLHGGKVKTAFEQLELDKNYQNRLENAVCESRDFRIHDKKLSHKLFGKNMKFSASQVEDFYKCSFSYFCKRGLRVKTPEKAKMSPMQSGNFIHYCLYRLVMDNGKEKLISLSNDEIFSQVEAITNDYLKTQLNLENVSNVRFEALLLRLRHSVVRLVKRIQAEFKETDFIPVKFEAKIGEQEEIKPINITLDDGGNITVEGAVDRVDEYEADGVKYVRVIDYKSGKKEFDVADVQYGLNMQMLLYLFTLCQEEGKQPAGVLYMPSGDSYISASLSDDSQKLSADRLKMQRANGLVLDDIKIIDAMEHDIKGVYIPVELTKNNEILKRKFVASNEDFIALKKQIEENLYKMGTALHNGDIFSLPTAAKGYTPCQYCSYQNICLVNQNAENSEIIE